MTVQTTMTARDLLNTYKPGPARDAADIVLYHAVGTLLDTCLYPGEDVWLREQIADEIRNRASCGGEMNGADETLGNIHSDADGRL